MTEYYYYIWLLQKVKSVVNASWRSWEMPLVTSPVDLLLA